MGVLEIAMAAIFLIAGIVGVSAVAGALIGRSRDIGAAKGFGWGLLLPVIGLGRVIASPKKEQTVDRKKEVPASIEQHLPGNRALKLPRRTRSRGASASSSDSPQSRDRVSQTGHRVLENVGIHRHSDSSHIRAL